jgi:6-phosphogluconolactonase (cycloisomerase 2 family)
MKGDFSVVRFPVACLLAAMALAVGAAGAGKDGRAEGGPPVPGTPGFPAEAPVKPGLLQTLTHEDFSGVTSITVAPGGKHAYAASFHKGLITLISRQPRSGRLIHVKSITGDHYKGAVAFRLSPDGEYGAASAFRSESVILFGRDPETGELKELDHAGGADRPMPGLSFCVDNVFSPDGQFLYTVGADSIVVFKVADNKLAHVETLGEPLEAGDFAAGKLPAMSGARGVAVTPDGKILLSSWNGSGTLLVHRRDLATGKLTLLQTLRNGAGVEKGLQGVMHVTVSPGGDYVYTSGGRFGGENAVCVFAVEPKSGHLNFVQCLMGADLPPDYDGGNEIAVSPDGVQVAVACTLSDCLTRFTRDPQNGKLLAIDSFACGPPANPGACGVTYDSTGRYLFVADENSSSVVAFRNR